MLNFEYQSEHLNIKLHYSMFGILCSIFFIAIAQVCISFPIFSFNMSSDLNIPYSKKHFIFSAFLFALMAFFPLYDIYQSDFTIIDFIWLSVVLIGFVFFFLRFMRPAMQGQYALEITPTGIIDNIRNRTIYWDDIDDLDTGVTNSSSLVIINLKDNSKYKPTTYIGYIPYYASELTWGSPIIIGTKFIDIDADKLSNEISSYREKLSSLKK